MSYLLWVQRIKWRKYVTGAAIQLMLIPHSYKEYGRVLSYWLLIPTTPLQSLQQTWIVGAAKKIGVQLKVQLHKDTKFGAPTIICPDKMWDNGGGKWTSLARLYHTCNVFANLLFCLLWHRRCSDIHVKESPWSKIMH